jgi:tRNA nucleotidyltransferase/poly(A) polymerase
LTEDALTKDITVNAIYYNIKEEKIEDPLNAIEDLKNGLIVTPLKDYPLKKDYFRAFRILRSSAELSMRISDYVEDYIKNNIKDIKVII